ncbi:hypothetical protein WMY93_033596 [Mugilogobius chulae]|uniref:Amine oxidase n=1 Tax=Mugilogobius chulae TaxID=88201 RepID=A0AAW0MTB0_9GOBI
MSVEKLRDSRDGHDKVSRLQHWSLCVEWTVLMSTPMWFKPMHFQNFELYLGQPLCRHLDVFHNNYGGMSSTAFVVRTITAIANYDYMWNFIFYQNGAVETKVHTTGHITSSFLVQDSLTHDQLRENGETAPKC